MAANISKTFFRSFIKRQYAASASPKCEPISGPEVQVTTLQNKMVVASAESPQIGLCKVAVAFRAGSRYETPENYGVSHILRSSAGLTTNCATHFAISKNIQQIGATLSAISDRETIIYQLETSSDQLDCGLQYLRYAIVGQEFRPWELSDNIPRIMYEISCVPPQVKVLDMIHKAAYRTGLGNSIYSKKYNVKKIGSETLKHFACSNLLTGRASVVGIGVDHGHLSNFAENLGIETGEGEAVKDKYYGGEVRKEIDSKLVHTIIAGESCGLNKKEVFTYAVLRHALGSGPNTRRGAGVDPLSKAISNIYGPTSVQSLAIAHSDTGLFGVLISCLPEDANTIITEVMKTLKSGVTEEDVKRGKAQLKAQILYSAESSDSLLNDLINQSALIRSAKSPTQLISSVDAVTYQEVKQAIAKIMAGNKSLATIGNLYNVPYLGSIA